MGDSDLMSVFNVASVPATPIVVGFSGGLDSSVLLHLLANRPQATAPLRAIHIHHGLHPDADAWAKHCQDICAALGVDLVIVNVSVPRDGGKGLEAAAREARYAAFSEQLRCGEMLALAHHRDDQAETILLRLLRASASEGLSAMRATRSFADGVLWRPLLAIPRTDLQTYAETYRLKWIEDPSNTDDRLDRNFLRQRVLPTLKQRWPQATAALARSADLLAEDAALLREEAGKRLAQAQGLDPATLSVAALCESSTPWRARVLRVWIDALAMPPLPGAAFAIIEKQLLAARADAEPEYRWSGHVLRRWRGLLHVETARPALPTDWRMDWNGSEPLLLPTGDHLHLVGAGMAAIPGFATATSMAARSIAAMPGPTMYFVSARHGGERITQSGRGHTQALKKILQELGIPPWERERLPLLFAADGELLAAGDLVISQRLTRSGMRLSWGRA